MKRFNLIDADQTNLMSIYDGINGHIPVQRAVITEAVGDHNIKKVKIFTQQKGRGADLTFYGQDCTVLSDDGAGGIVLTALDGDIRADITATKDNASVKMSGTGAGDDGRITDEFVTNVAPRLGSGGSVLTIININEL